MCASISKSTGRSWFAIDVLRSAKQEAWSAYISGIHPFKSLWEEPLSSSYGKNWKVINSSLCLPIWVDVSENVFVLSVLHCENRIKNRERIKCILRPYSQYQPCICHIYGLTPYVEFLSSRSNYDAFWAKGPLQWWLTVCKNFAQRHHVYRVMCFGSCVLDLWWFITLVVEQV